MAVYTSRKEYNTKAHMGMIDITEDFQSALNEAFREKGIKDGIITGFTTGGVAGLTTLEFEPGLVYSDLKKKELLIYSPLIQMRQERSYTINTMTHGMMITAQVI